MPKHVRAMPFTANTDEVASRTLGERLGEEANILDYFKTPDADYSNALALALATGKVVVFPYRASGYNIGSTFNLATVGTKIRSKGGVAKIILTGSSGRLFTISNKNIEIEGFEIDASASGLASNRAIEFSGALAQYSTVRRVKIISPKQGFGFSSGAQNCVLVDWEVESTTEQAAVRLDGAGTSLNVIARGKTNNNVGFGIILLNGANRNEIAFNSCTVNGLELIGVTSDCWGNRIIGNHAEGTHDNGISVTGYQNLVVGNHCRLNYHAGIWLYGRENTCVGNNCVNNNQRRTVDGVSAYSGIAVQAGWGGLGRLNVVTGNTAIDDQVTPTQTYGVCIEANGYVAWAAGQTVVAGYPWRRNGLRLYRATNISGASLVTGATPPTHSSGSVSDGTITWLFWAEVDDIVDATKNEIGDNTCRGNRLGDFADLSAGVNNVRTLSTLKRNGVTLRFDHTQDIANNITSVFHDLHRGAANARPWPSDLPWQSRVNQDNKKLEYSDGTNWYDYAGTLIDHLLIDYDYEADTYKELGSTVTFASRHTFTRSGVASLRAASPATTITDFSTGVPRRDGRGILAARSAANIYPSSASPSTQTISLAAGTYTLDVVGAFTVALSGGPTGTASDGSPVEFTLGSTTSVTFTVSGTPTGHINLIVEPAATVAGETYATDPIKNAGASTTRNQELLSENLASLSLTKGTVVFIGRTARYKAASATFLNMGADTNNGISLRYNSGATSFLLLANVGGVNGTIGTLAAAVANNTRFCAAFTFDMATGEMYGSINGSAPVRATIGGSFAINTMALLMAMGGANPSDAFGGKIKISGQVASLTTLAAISQLSAWP